MVLFGFICRGLLGGSPTLANLVEDHGFISEEQYLRGSPTLAILV